MKFVKKIAFIAILLCFSFSSYSSIVSNNDGDSFVTKGQFDELKNNFSNQINEYNKSIDNKISGAISSYLSGMSVADYETISLPYGHWGKVTAVEAPPITKYCYPDLSLTKMAFYNGTTSLSGYSYKMTWWAYANILYKRISTSTAPNNDQRFICDAGVENNLMPDAVIWKGRSINYIPNILINLLSVSNDSSQTSGYIDKTNEGKMYLCNILDIQNGYYSTLSDEVVSNLWNPKLYWDGNNTDTAKGNRSDGAWKVRNANFSVTLGTNEAGDTTDYTHIIHYVTKDNMNFSDPDWVHTLSEVPDDNLKIWKLKNEPSTDFSIIGKWGGTNGYNNRNGNTYHAATVFDGYNIGSYGESDESISTIASTVGLLTHTYNSRQVIQTDETFTQKIDGSTFTDEPKNLISGFTCFAVKQYNTYTWSPVFTDTKTDGVDTNFELDVSLSTVPFEEGFNLTSGDDDYIRSTGQTADYLTTSSRTCTFTFTADESGIVYCKWRPTDDNILSSKWEASLNLDACNTYLHQLN